MKKKAIWIMENHGFDAAIRYQEDYRRRKAAFLAADPAVIAQREAAWAEAIRQSIRPPGPSIRELGRQMRNAQRSSGWTNVPDD